MTRAIPTSFLLCLLVVSLAVSACDDDETSEDASPDAQTADAQIADAQTADASTTDALEDGTNTESDASTDVPPSPADTGQQTDAQTACEGDCAIQDLTATFELGTGPLSRSAYGLTAPEAEGGAWTIYLEAWEGGFEGCPDEASPTPERTFILAGIPLDDSDRPTEGGELSATLLDYQATLLEDEVFASATAVELEVRGSELCTDCVGGQASTHPEGYVSLQVSATFSSGTVSGGIYATHCDSMDE